MGSTGWKWQKTLNDSVDREQLQRLNIISSRDIYTYTDFKCKAEGLLLSL